MGMRLRLTLCLAPLPQAAGKATECMLQRPCRQQACNPSYQPQRLTTHGSLSLGKGSALPARRKRLPRSHTTTSMAAGCAARGCTQHAGQAAAVREREGGKVGRPVRCGPSI